MHKFFIISAFGVALVAAPTLAQSKEVSEVRDLAEFSRIVIESSADLDVRVGETQRVEVFAEDDDISRIETEVRGGTLYISMKNRFWSRHHHVNLNIQVKSLDGIEIDGSGDISVINIDSKEFMVEINGSGDVDLEGKCGTFTIVVEGSGDIDSKAMKCATASVEIDGSGDVDIYASESVVLDINGSGDVTIYGDPDNVRPTIRGSGDIRFVDNS